jgi:hypothetical protein
MRLTALAITTTHNTGRQDDEVGEGNAEVEHRDAQQAEGAGGQYLAGHLGRRRHLAQVVEEADTEDDGGRDDHAERLRRAREDGFEPRQDGRHAHGHEEGDEHRRAADRRKRCRVHAPLVGIDDGPDAHRHLPHERRQRVGDAARHCEDDQVAEQPVSFPGTA